MGGNCHGTQASESRKKKEKKVSKEKKKKREWLQLELHLSSTPGQPPVFFFNHSDL